MHAPAAQRSGDTKLTVIRPNLPLRSVG